MYFRSSTMSRLGLYTIIESSLVISLMPTYSMAYFCLDFRSPSPSSDGRSIGRSPSFFGSLISGNGKTMFPSASKGLLLMSGSLIS